MASNQETVVIKARMDRIPSALSPELVERIAADRASGYVNPYRCNDDQVIRRIDRAADKGTLMRPAFMRDTEKISAYTTTILHFIAPFYAIFSIIENASGSIRGAGVSLQPMMLTIFGTVVLRVIWVFAIMPFDPSLEHLLLVYPVTWLITATMFTIYHHSGNWLGRATA